MMKLSIFLLGVAVGMALVLTLALIAAKSKKK